ncbi:PP2C family protein-serine/threonine phosphatase [Aphanothece sacrum]|uniref:Two-component response regulator n=1 Tax=Aphanothece sacrum FPU1 TaxID=1920663 RepID=A0A401IFT9_APHSA|nr:SpoIIE family protein phosphatase [Aphanothece sacrum]GBF80069.1 two-component response regulator [Aphanothece sacrum FPU1]GBF84612.1 two-component response regulator [Aphanothece sacrum FPU3]
MVQILLIDDDRTIRMLLERTLKRSGYDVICASKGEEGLNKARELQPALIICDWVMPGISGLEVCRQVKSIPELATTFFVLLTSLGSVEDRVNGLDAGADDFLCKPIEMNELIARVRAGLRLHQLSQDLKEQKQLLETELAEAADYVSSILPEPVTDEFVKIESRFIPSSQLGGDGFDYFWLDEYHLVVYLLDVSGHGLRAALPSISVINLLRSRGLNRVDYYRPSEVLRGLNEAFQMSDRNDKYFTIWYGVYNRQTQVLLYSSAGHPPAILLTKNVDNILTVNYLKTPGFPIGMFPDTTYINAELSLNCLSRLYIFSDGIYEIEKADGTVLGLPDFIGILKDYQQENQGNLEKLLLSLSSHHQKAQFDDDLSIIQIDFSAS